MLLLIVLAVTGCTSEKVEILTEEPIDLVYEPMDLPKNLASDRAIAYQIFPIAFADGSGDGIGDIQGIIDQLDYLKEDLNVDVIWLTPVHPSPSYHKYDVLDYFDIDPAFGTLEDYKNLIAEVHKRDMLILMDFVINHTSSKHPWFLEAKSSPDSPYRDYYVWNDFSEDEFHSKDGWYRPDGSEAYYFASFWSEMPELNFSNPKVREEIKKISDFWLTMGVDGFRIDAAKHIFDINEYPKGTPVLSMNHEWFIEMNAHIKSVKPDAFLLLELWDNASTVSHFLKGSDSAFNFDMATGIVSAVVSENRKNVQEKLPRIYRGYDQVTTQYVDSIFLANHDQDRVMSQLGGNVEKAKLAATIQMTLPGISWIYYGEEIGMMGSKPDEDIREGFKWTDDQVQAPNSNWRPWRYTLDVPSLEVQRKDEASLFSHYKSLTALKSKDPVLRMGEYVDLKIGTSFRIFAYYRTLEAESYLVLHNLHGEHKELTFVSDLAEIIYKGHGVSVSDGRIILSPYGSLVLRVDGLDVVIEEVGN